MTATQLAFTIVTLGFIWWVYIRRRSEIAAEISGMVDG